MEIVSSSQEIHSRVQQVFHQVFEDSTLVISEKTKADDVPSWDSITHISLILALEEEFGIEFSSEEVTSMTCVGDLFAVLQKKQ